MSNLPMLGKLQKVAPKKVWAHEALAFTPWLALPENLTELGNALGMELELEAIEQAVGPFRADILCKRVGTDHWVLIENQLEKTDHLHLGQILTYAAGLDAVTVVWIAPNFTDEHRACLDWLNRVTVEGLNFFGVQIEVWQIGDSDMAPRLQIVSRPNQWAKSVSSASASISNGKAGQAHLEYWTGFIEALKKNGGPIKPVTPGTQNWITFSAFGRSGFTLTVASNVYEKRIRVGMYITPKNADAFFTALKTHKAEIESGLGPVVWHDTAVQERAVLQYLGDADGADKSDWQRQHDWMIERLRSFYRVFAPIVKTLQPAPLET